MLDFFSCRVYNIHDMSYIRKIKRDGKIYLAEVTSQRINGKVVQKHIRYIGKEEQGKKIFASSISNAEIEQVKLYGPLLVLHHLAKEIKLPEILGNYNKELLCLIYAHCLDYTSINQMSRWFSKTDLAMLLDISSLSEERLLRALDSIQDRETIERIENEIFMQARHKYNLKSSGIVYDVTNTYLYGKKCPLAKIGHDKDGVKGRPLIQIAIGVTRQEGIPIFHKTFNGNIHDAKTLEDIFTSFRTYQIPKSFMVFDRGITSKNSVKSLKNHGWEVIGGLALRGGYPRLLRQAIKSKKFMTLENRVKQNNTTWYVVSEPHTYREVCGTLSWCFNERLRQEVRESRYDEIEYARECRQEGKEIKSNMRKYFDSVGNIKKDVLKQSEEFDGYSAIFTTQKLGKKDILKLYFGDKDIVEKAFRSLKGVVRVRPIRHWLYNRVIAHIFICYLSYMLLSLLRYRLRPLGISPVEALRELETLYRVYIRDPQKEFKLEKTVTLTKKQSVIIKTIDKCLL